jgi:hypothetical protein
VELGSCFFSVRFGSVDMRRVVNENEQPSTIL